MSKSFTPDDIQYIKENYGTLTSFMIAEELNRSPAAIRVMALRKGIDNRLVDDIIEDLSW